MNKQNTFGAILNLNGINVPTQKDFGNFVITPIKDYPFNSSVITKYEIRNIENNSFIHITPENLFNYLSEITEQLI
jgi:hypothetical protein